MRPRTLLSFLPLVAALILGAALVAGPSSPSCVPIEPLAPMCEAARDCTWCMYKTKPTSPADCECALCTDWEPMNQDVCQDNADAYFRHCGHLECPNIACEQPPPLDCVDGACVMQPEACGDPTARANYAACTAARDQTACRAAGGDWTVVGLSPEPSCQCRTGQEDCPCDGPDDCLSSCIAPLESGAWECENAQGFCSPVSLTVGCHCWFWEEGEAQGICAD